MEESLFADGGGKSMALIDRIKHDGPPDELVYKWRTDKADDKIVMGAQLIVNESQEALFFKEGQALDLLGPGTHTLSTKNLPLLQKLVNLPFGGQTPFAAEVWFINRTARLNYKWGTTTPIPIEDPKYKVLIQMGCFGQYGLRVSDSRLFVTQIVGTMSKWESADVVDYFRGAILTRVKDTVAKFLLQNKLSVSSITAYMDDISKLTEERLRDEFAKYGLDLLRFFITAISIPDEELKRIQKGAFERLEIEQVGDERYKMKRSLDIMETAAGNTAAAGTVMAAGIGLGVGSAMAKPLAQTAQESLSHAAPTGAPASIPSGLACPKCNATVPAGSKFCSGCGNKLGADCPSCGATVSTDAKFCSQCGGKTLVATLCPSCGASVALGTKFCQQCGKPLA
jgi:membrane protease subunit (stomatin/prohibitin family)